MITVGKTYVQLATTAGNDVAVERTLGAREVHPQMLARLVNYLQEVKEMEAKQAVLHWQTGATPTGPLGLKKAEEAMVSRLDAAKAREDLRAMAYFDLALFCVRACINEGNK